MTSRLKLAAALAAIVASTAFASIAHAGPVVPDAADCADEAPRQVFAPWLDPAGYVLAPDGGFEADAADWELAGAQVIEGNEPWSVRAVGDRRSLAIDGGSATTPPVCVGIEHPTIRFFARNTGSPLGVLNADVLVRTTQGLTAALQIGTVDGAGDGWAPTLPMPVVANLLSLLPGERTIVRFRFRAEGAASSWVVDDVHVDPYSKG